MVDGAKLLIRSGADWRDKRSTSSFSHLSRVGSFEKSQVASAQCTATQLPCLPLQCRSDRWFQVFSNKNWPYSRFDLISCLHCIHRTLLLGYSIRKFLCERFTHRIPQESLFIAVGHEGRLHAVFGRWAYPTHPPLHSEKSSRPALPLSALCCSSASEGRGHNVTVCTQKWWC